MTFGDKLRDILDKKEMQQKEFARIMNITPASLNGYVNNRRLPNILLVRDFAKELGVSVDYLLDYAPISGKVAMSPKEIEMIKKYRSMPEEKQKIIESLIELF